MAKLCQKCDEIQDVNIFYSSIKVCYLMTNILDFMEFRYVDHKICISVVKGMGDCYSVP